MKTLKQAMKMLLLLLVAAGVGAGLSLLLIDCTDPAGAGEGLSSLGRAVYRAGKDRWTQMESAHFVGYASSPEGLTPLLSKAEFAYSEVEKALTLDPLTNKAHCFLITDVALWQEIRQRRGWRTDGRALQSGRDFVLFMAPDELELNDAVPHEIVHYRLREMYENRIPLALEEGLACYLGWEITLAYHLKHGKIITRTKSRIASDVLWPLNELVNAADYDQDADRNLAFYRQSEDWVRGVTSLITGEELAEFVRLVFSGEMDWEQALKERWGCTERQIDQVRAAVEKGAFTGRQ